MHVDPGKGAGGGEGGSKRGCGCVRCGRARKRCACLQATEFYSANRLVLRNREEHAQRVHPAVERVGVSVLVDRPLTATNDRQQPSAQGAGRTQKVARGRQSGGRTISWCPHAPYQRTSPEDAPAGSGPRTAPGRSSRRLSAALSAADAPRGDDSKKSEEGVKSEGRPGGINLRKSVRGPTVSSARLVSRASRQANAPRPDDRAWRPRGRVSK